MSAKLATLADSFTVKDTVKWIWSGTAAIVNGQLNLPLNSSYSSSVTSAASYDLTNSSVSVQLVSIAPGGSGSTEQSIQLYLSATAKLSLVVGDSGQIFAQYTTSSGSTTVGSATYNAATMKYLRISHNGSQVIYSYSADAQHWTQLGAWTPTFAITALQVVLLSGYWGTETSPGTAVFDNVNIGTVAVDTARVTQVENASATALTVSVPVGTMPGDVLVLSATAGGGQIAATLTGWTTIATQTAGSNAAGGLYYRIATATEPSSYTLTGLTSTAQKISASMVRLSGVDPLSPLDAPAVTSAPAPGAPTVTAPTVTTATVGSAVFYLPIIDSASTTDWSVPAALTQIQDTGGTGKRLVTAYEIPVAVGATTARTFTQTGTTGLSNAFIVVAFRAASQANTLALVATTRVANSGVTDASITVPAGVTTSHLGILTVEAANQGIAAMTVPSGWTLRGANPGTGGSTATLYTFTRLGGVKAGDTITVTLPSNTGATTTAAWYDTAGRDISHVSAVYTTNSADVTTVTFNAPGHSGTRDVLLAAPNRTTTANTLPAPSGVTLDLNGQESSWLSGAFFGHAANVPSQAYTATWTPSGATSHNVNAFQFALALPKAARFSDDFAVKDTVKWSWGAAAAVTSGQLVCTANSSYTGNVNSASPYDMTGSSVAVQVLQTLTGSGTGTPETFLQLFDSVANSTTKNSLMWDKVGTNLIAYVRDSSGTSITVATLTYSATTHAWWRIRTDATGANAYWDTSPDGLTWTQQATKAITIPVASMTTILGTGYSGTFTPTTTTAIFDNVNLTPPAPKMATFTDDFTTQDTGKWWFDSGLSVVSGQLNIPVTSGYPGAYSNAHYDLTSSAVTAQIVQTPNVGSGSTETFLTLRSTAGTSLYFDINNGVIGAYRKAFGVMTTVGTVTYNAATMKYLRIVHDGTAISWQYSANGSTWTTIGSPWTPTVPVSWLDVELVAGYWGTETSPGTAIWDNVNVLPPTGVQRFKIGAADPTALYVGSAAVSAVYLGSTQVWP